MKMNTAREAIKAVILDTSMVALFFVLTLCLFGLLVNGMDTSAASFVDGSTITMVAGTVSFTVFIFIDRLARIVSERRGRKAS
jgi:hypothetical protein